MLGVTRKESNQGPDQRQSLFDKTFKDRNGTVALAQLPNVPLGLWLVAMLTGKVVRHGGAATGVRIVTYGALLVWALLEIFQGVNYFRRTLGLVVLVMLLVSIKSRL